MRRLAAASLTLACAICTGTAHAQSSVLMYGILDVGVQSLTNAGKDGTSSLGMLGSAFLPSRFGFKGDEDLGGGYGAIFQLENGFDLGKGTLVTPGTLFNRLSSVGIRSPYGRLTFGRQYSVQFDKTVLYDPTYFANDSTLSLNLIPLATLRLNNAVKFQSESLYGFNVDAEYGFGQQLPGNMLAGRYVGAALEYVRGTFAARVLYEQSRGTSNGGIDASGHADERYSAALRYTVGGVTLSAGVTRVLGDLQLTPRGTIYWGGAKGFATPTIQWYLLGGRYDFQRAPEHPTLFVGGAEYLLSKATFVYGHVGTVWNSGDSGFGVNSYSNVGQRGKSQVGVSVGINHKF
ncbi:porin [Burkholderia sp. Ac-20353]|uniref:porin n=1 Tax=Burkholderia sp. Ac-20353 TaxID=2703894 RepID=UPI00197CA3B7|nr:porin [Burkholderia sp. Ac-20353]MBN3786338.1 porin [Burkholderia sp. Ac-20353]